MKVFIIRNATVVLQLAEELVDQRAGQSLVLGMLTWE